INVVVVADSDTLYDEFWLNKQDFMGQKLAVPTAANGDFLINALDNMSGSSALIGLRSRGLSTRPFEVVEDLRRQAEQKFQAREQELQAKLEKTQQKISALQSQARPGSGALLSAEQQSAIRDAREQVVKTRKQLRDVQHDLNNDIERLEGRLKFANIGLIPILVFLVAIVLAAVRYQRRRRRAHTKLN
ncbi:MAG TPA: ABC transporter, partial [Alphaproteobacteria bacterium]|nr:ABC transporter [Alphaproteobacteria bacterium]